MMRAVIYVRVSTDEQTRNLSLPTQQRACADYCQRNGIDVDKVFIEEGESAKTVNRPQFQKLLAYCRENKGRVHYVVVYNLTRFARNTHDHLAVRALLHSFGVSLRSVNEPIDDTSTGKLMEAILASFAQFDNDVRADRTVAGMKAALENGRWTHQAPLGYVNATGKDGKPTLIPDPDRADLVRKAFDLYSTGLHTKQHVLRTINDMGLRTRRGKRVPGQTFFRMLRSPVYAGWLTVSKWGVRTRAGFEPLISEETFGSVQSILAGKRPTIATRQRKHPDFPLRAFVECGHCNRPLTGSKSTGRRGVRYSYYHCTKCGAVRERKIDFEKRFVDYLERLQPNPQYVKGFKQIVLSVWQQKQAETITAATAIEHELQELRDRKDKLVEAFVYRQAIDQATYQRQLDKLNEEVAIAEMSAHDAKLEALDVESVLNFAEHVMLNAARLWTEFSSEQKERLQRVLFPEGVQFSDGEFRTAATCSFFNVLQPHVAEKSHLAAPTGIEPVSRP